MDIIRHKNDESRQGIALILVVGMLGLMMVLAVAFAVFMRTERVAAGSFRNDVRVRALVQVALSRAVAAIDADMTATNRIYPTWDALYSGGTNYVRESLTKNALDQIPLGALIPQGTCLEGTVNYVVVNHTVSGGNKGVVINLTDHSFGLITNVVSLGGGNNKIFHTALSGGRVNAWANGSDQFYILQPAMVDIGGGRYGFVVINCSGLPDANYAGGMARGMGTNAAEIQIQSLPGGVITNALGTDRQVPYETHQELVLRGRANGAFTDYPDSYVCYSSSVTNDGRVYIGGTAADAVSNLISRHSAIVTKLQNLTVDPSYSGQAVSFTLAEAENLFTNLVDFVDSDCIPGNLGNPASPGNPEGISVEKVPMANEIVLTNRVVFSLNMGSYPAATNYVMSGTNMISVEFATPIVNPESIGVNFKWKIALEGVSGPPALFSAAGSLYSSNSWGLSVKPLDVRGLNLPMVGDAVLKPISLSPITSSYNAKVMTLYQGKTVDSVTNSGVPLTVTTVISPSGGTINPGVYSQYVGIGVAIMECIDPRLNGLPGAWSYRAGRPNTLGSDNFQALLRLDPYTYGNVFDINNYGAPSKGKDGDTVMYVANAPLNSVGDLGYLFCGTTVYQTWETVRLFRIGDSATYGKMHAVLDYFTTDNPADGIIRGRINPNTQGTNVLRSAFADMPINKRHATVSVSLLNAAQLDSVVSSIVNKTATNEFSALSGLGAIRWDQVLPSLNSLEKESVIRNSSGLFDVRQNFFVVLLYGDVMKQDMAGNYAVISSSMGLAEVWRDPQDSANGYPVSIRSFQIMESP